MANINFYNVTVSKADTTNQIVVRGEVENRSGRNYNAMAIRIILFKKSIVIASTVTVVNGLLAGKTKNFEKTLEDLDYTVIFKDITRWEIIVESTY
ncbi:MAG: FxLYD domain-containing protein [Candidatus Omnitrophica bacterium]|nr:FxLYD domain-containing protein [Candidatus Omnitrophota bacterium]